MTETMEIDSNFMLDHKEEDGNTILHLIVSTMNYKCVKAILRYSKYLNFREKNDIGMTPLCFACTLKEVPFEIVSSLITFDHDTINIPDNLGFTPLHHAVINRRLDLVTLLIEKGVSTNTLDLRNRTPLHYCALNCETEMIEAMHHRDVGSSFDNLTNLDVLRYLLETGNACATVRDKFNKTPLDIICNCLSTHNLYISYEHPIVKCLETIAPFTYNKGVNYDFIKIFELLYTAIRSSSIELAEFCINRFYCDLDLNSQYAAMVKRYGELLRDEGNGNLFQLCIFLHEDYQKNRVQLRHFIDDINHLNYCFFTLSLDEMIENDEAVELTQLCMKTLKNEGIDFSRQWFQEEIGITFDLPFPEYTQVQFHRMFQFFDYIFKLDAGIDFNSLSLKYVENCFWSIRAGVPSFYDNLLYCELFFAFCSDTQMHQKIAEEIYKMDEQWNQNVMIDYNRVLQNVERFLNVVTYNELANYCNFYSYFDIDYKVYSLKQMCRNQIRECVGRNNPWQNCQEFVDRINSLPIPIVLKKYLRFIDTNFDYLNLTSVS
uniref:CSON003861 protein n=1 Tax=Culicoides sonorensis TaxID=179676 RepID=A0A336MR56_CULSO